MSSQSTTTTVLVNVEAGVMEITLNRPDSLNSLNVDMHAQLQTALDAASKPDVRAVLLTGTGRGFCAGQDLAEQDPSHEGYDPDLGKTVEKFYNPLIRKIRELDKPVVCAVNGIAAGAGVSVALACDIVIAGESAKFIQAFARIGLVPDSGSTWFLPHLVGPARAMGMALLTDPITAETAQEWGLIWQVAKDEDLMQSAREMVQKLAQGPTFSYGLIKQAMQAASTNSLNEQLELEKVMQRSAGFSHDFREGVQAFLEKRAPKFKGKEKA